MYTILLDAFFPPYRPHMETLLNLYLVWNYMWQTRNKNDQNAFMLR
jgi:hypothetical protein